MANATLNQLNYKGTLYDIEDSEARNGLATKADANSVYTKNEVDTALNNKADKSTTYTKTEVDTALGGKVDKETGKGLSTNDYTTAEKQKLAGIEPQANKTTVDDALSGSSENPVQNKVVKSALDSKANASTTYTKTEVDTALSGKQNVIDGSHKLSADLVDDTSTTNKFATAAELEQIKVNKNNILTAYNANGTKNKFKYTLFSLKNLNTAGTWQQNVYSLNNGNTTFTVNDDMSVTVVSTNHPSGAVYRFYLQYYSAVSGDMLCSGLSAASLTLFMYTTGGSTYTNRQPDVVYDSDDIGVLREIAIVVSANTTATTFKPMICTSAEYAISPTYQPHSLSNVDLTDLTHDITHIKVMQYNIGKFNMGHDHESSYIADYATAIANCKKFFANTNADFICMQEFTDYIDTSNTYLTDTTLFAPIYLDESYREHETIIYSQYALSNTRFTYLHTTGDNPAYAIVGEFNAKGKKIAIVSGVLNSSAPEGIDHEQQGLRALTKLTDIILTDYDYAIVGMDCNCLSQPEAESFLTFMNGKGYRAGNWAYLGYKDTYNLSSQQYKAIDNVFVKGNMRIVNFEVPDVYSDLMSDHFPVIADIVV